MALGLLVVIGWAFDLPNLKGIYGEITIKANTAIALTIAAASLYLLTTHDGTQHNLGQVCAASIVLVGLMTLSEHAIGWDAVAQTRRTGAALTPTQTSQEVFEEVERPCLAGAKIWRSTMPTIRARSCELYWEGYGADVLTAPSAREGLELMASWKPDVLLCDIGMPEEDGYSLIKRIRKLPPEHGGRIPAIALTGYVRVEDRMRALEGGYQMFVPKPVEAMELVVLIDDLRRRTSL